MSSNFLLRIVKNSYYQSTPDYHLNSMKEILEYHMFLKDSIHPPKTKTSTIISCKNDHGNFDGCSRRTSDDPGHCCILSKLVIPWQKSGYETMTVARIK